VPDERNVRPGPAGVATGRLGRVDLAAGEVRDDAAPFALGGVVVLVTLALVSRQAGWETLGHTIWWLWLVAAAPYGLLSVMLPLGISRLVAHARRRDVVIGLLALVWLFNMLGVGLLVASLVAHSGHEMTGGQLLLSGGTVWLTNVVVFGLTFWELDGGGPVARAIANGPATPDFRFPQHESPALAPPEWAPRLWDYVYVSFTNSIAFSPTDAMPFTRRAKALMAAESTLSMIAVLLVTARAVNVLN
jgi:uncharacterized membrane protein